MDSVETPLVIERSNKSKTSGPKETELLDIPANATRKSLKPREVNDDVAINISPLAPLKAEVSPRAQTPLGRSMTAKVLYD